MKKRSKKKNRIRNRVIKNVVVTILLLTFGISTAFLGYLHFFASNDKNLSGEWIADLDMTEQAAVAAFVWLQDIEAVSVSLEDMETYMPKLTIQVNLTLEQTGHSAGTFRSNVWQADYDACHQAAYEAFAAVFREIVAERLHMAGYTGGMDEESVEALVVETFGMSTTSYLISYGPSLLPSLEELQAQYGGSGTYEAAEGVLTRRYDAGSVAEKAERYIRKDTELVLSEEIGSGASGLFSDAYPMVYTLQETGEK